MFAVRYFVDNVEQSVTFYTEKFGFKIVKQFPAMAIVSKDDLTLWLAGPQSSAARSMPDGSTPSPGGWNRFVLQVENIEDMVQALRNSGVQFRNEIISGPGGKQTLCEDPSGNVIELFQPAE